MHVMPSFVVATQTFVLASGGPGEHTPSRNYAHWSDERIGGGLKRYRFRRRTARTDDAVPRLGVPPLLGPAPAAELSGALASPFPRKGEAGFRDNRKNKLIAFGADRFVENNHMIQAFAPNGANHALDVSSLPG